MASPHIAHLIQSCSEHGGPGNLAWVPCALNWTCIGVVANRRQNQVHVSYNPYHAIRGYNLGVSQVPHEMGTTTPQISG